MVDITVTDADGAHAQSFSFQNGTSNATYTVEAPSGNYIVNVVFQGNGVRTATIASFTPNSDNDPSESQPEFEEPEREIVEVVLNNVGFHCNTFGGNSAVTAEYGLATMLMATLFNLKELMM